ncbi:striatin-3-like isoform X3 [Ruditapes philippinarum]|uniref:striatin-3-like isoform X3 n=1 Tax=Ruditapes philippinarum TaxID=129788 RepID=UPI00295B41D1|nr:striatin-3-like isoform X3 [Ruditapes philippinarum]
MIDEGPGSLSGGQGNPMMSGGPGMTSRQQQDESNQRTQYSMPGILHFLQTEWARFEMERSQWEVERAELQARIAFLQGERKGQENLKQDLVRRIKMLEFALKQERAKYHKLKYGSELNQDELKPPSFDKDSADEVIDTNPVAAPASSATWRQGRQLLRQYLQEIGYTDTIIDVRSARVRSLLGLQPQTDTGEGAQPALVNGDSMNNRRAIDQGKARGSGKMPASLVEGALMDSEASVLATFDFLANENVVDDDDENLSDENEEGISAEDEADERIEKNRGKIVTAGIEGMAGVDDETEEVLAEFDFLVSEAGEGAGEAQSHGDGPEWVKKDLGSPNEEWGVDQQLISKLKEEYKKERKGKKARPKRSTLQAMLANLTEADDLSSSQTGAASSNQNSMSEVDDLAGVQSGGNLQSGNRKPVIGVNSNEEDLDAAIGVGLGELAEITVNNDADPGNYDISAPTEVFRKTWNAKYTLRSHFDGVRTLAFHPVEPVLITGSEDHTLKLWNLQKTVPAKKAASLDVEPVYTFRAHVGPVLCLAVSASGEQCYSGGIDSSIRCWNIPSSNIDPYDSFDSNVLQDTMVAHTDAVWGLSIHNTKSQLLSCSADGTVRLWSPGTKSPLLNTFTVDSEDGVPTSVDFVRCDPGQMVAAYTSANTYLFDLETNKQVLTLETKQNNDAGTNNQINCVVNHPTLPITITAHEDRHIRFFDINTGKMIHSMVAHLDAVTCLAVDPNGLYLLSGSHDCSIRLWNLDSKTCVQEITAHRKKFDESIHAVVFHPSKPYIASAGADALAKVFV